MAKPTNTTRQFDLLLSSASQKRLTAFQQTLEKSAQTIASMKQDLKNLGDSGKALKMAELARRPGALDNSMRLQGVSARRDVAMQGSSEARMYEQAAKSVSRINDLELARSRTLRNNAAEIAKIRTIEEATAKIRAADLRIGIAIVDQDKRKLTTAQQLKSALEGRLGQLRAEQAQVAQITREEEKRAAAQLKQRMQPVTDQLNAQRSRELSQQRLFGDGGANLLRIQAGLMANYAMVNLVTSAFSNAVSASVEFDNSLRNLQAIVKISDGGMESLKGTIVAAADASRFTANEVSQAATVLGQAGFSNAQIRQSVSAVAQLATATGTELTRAVDVATSVIGIFNLEASRMQVVANTLTQAVNSSKLDIEKLTLGLQYAGNTAYDAGISFEELTAGLGAMANAGIRSGSTLGTGMRQILVSLEKPSETFQRNLHKLGLTTYDVDLKTKGLYGVMKTLREAGFSAGDAIESFEVRSAAAFIALSNNLPLMDSMQQSFFGSAAASEAQATQMRSLSGQAERLNGIISSLTYQALEPMLYALRDAAQYVGDFLITLRDNGDALRNFGTLAATLGASLIALKIGKVTAGFLGLLPVLKVFSGTIGIIPAQIVALNAAQASAAVSTNVFSLAIGNFTRQLALARVAAMTAGTSMLSLGNMARVAGAGFAALWSTMGVLLPVVGALTVAYYAFSSASSSYNKEQERANNTIDMWRTKLQNSKGAVESYRSKIKEVEDRIQSLSNRSKELNRNQDMLRSEISRVRSQFAGMESAIDGTESSVETLIGKLQALWTQLQQQYVLKIGIQISNLKGLATALNLQGMDIGNRMSAAQFDGQSQDAELEAAYGEVVRTRGTPAFNDARAKFDTLIGARQTELENKDYMDLPAAETPEGFQDPIGIAGIVTDPRFERRSFLEESLNRATSLTGLVNEMGTLEANKLDVQSQMSLAEIEEMDATSRSTLAPVNAQRLTLQNKIRDGLAEIEKKYSKDPIARYQATVDLANQYLPSIQAVESQIENRNGVDLTDNVVKEQLGQWNEVKGLLTGAAADAFSEYDKEQNSIEDDQARTSSVVYQGVLEKARRSNTVADADANYDEVQRQAHMLRDQEGEAITTSLPLDQQGNPIESVASRDAFRNADRMLEERLRDIERERQNTIERIESGDGGQTAIARANFDRQIDDLRTSDSNIKNKFDNGELRRSDAAAGMSGNIQSAESMLTALTAERQRLEAKGSMTPEEQAYFRQLTGSENTLRDYIRNRGSEINSFLNDQEGSMNTAADRAFSANMSGLQNRVEETRIAARLKEIDEQEAKNRYARIQEEAQTQLSGVQGRIQPIQTKIDSNMPLTPAEERTYDQGVREEKRLRSFLSDNLSNVEGAGGGSSGSGAGTADAGAGRDFNLMMDQFKTGMTDAEQDLKYNEASGPEAVSRMEQIIAGAKEELEVRRQMMAAQTEGSAEYNRLKSEERTLLGFIREEEASIRKIKEEQGLAQIDLLASVRAWAAENLNISKGLEDGFMNVLGSMKNGLSTLFSDLMTGTKSAKEAFRDFAMSVVESIQNVIAEMMAMYIMKKILGLFGMTISGGGGAEIVPVSQMMGGAVRKAGGGEVTGNVARDSKLHMLMPGEYVLRKKAVDMIGLETLNAMNAMGNRAMATGGHVGVANQKKGPLGHTNVYVVAPEQQPVPGPSDIIAVINDDIARGGSTKKLIKSVAMGY